MVWYKTLANFSNVNLTKKIEIDMTEQFLQQTAKDYDMPLNEVRNIADNYPEQFYQKLKDKNTFNN